MNPPPPIPLCCIPTYVSNPSPPLSQLQPQSYPDPKKSNSPTTPTHNVVPTSASAALPCHMISPAPETKKNSARDLPNLLRVLKAQYRSGCKSCSRKLLLRGCPCQEQILLRWRCRDLSSSPTEQTNSLLNSSDENLCPVTTNHAFDKQT